MQSDGPGDGSGLREAINRAISRELPRLKHWVEERTPSAEDADQIIRQTRREFADDPMPRNKMFALVVSPEQTYGLLASPEQTYRRLCSIAKRIIINRVISHHRIPLRNWVQGQILDVDGADEITQVTCIKFAAAEGWAPGLIDSPVGPEILASTARTHEVLRSIAHFEIRNWHRVRVRRREENLDSSGEQAGVGDSGPEPYEESSWNETRNQIRSTLDRCMEALTDEERLVITLPFAGVNDEEIAKRLDEDIRDRLATAPGDRERDEILKTAKAKVRQIRCRALDKMAGNAGEDFCGKLAECLNHWEREVIDASCWDDPSDEGTSRRLGTKAENVRHTRSRAFPKVKIRAGELGVAWDDIETRVAWASYRAGLSDPSIASGFKISSKDVKAIRRQAREKMLGEFKR